MLLLNIIVFVCTFARVVSGAVFESSIRNANKNYQKLKIEDGYVKGTIQKLLNPKKSVYAFRGIPYAKPPEGKLRFEPPVKNDKWNGVLDATKDRSECVQGSTNVTGSEDCLYISVYSPKLDGNLPVLVWIYGGGFIGGSSSYDYYTPDPILEEENVIYVAMNYRIGIFGFMSTGDKVVPGNMGLKDQCLALKWVQKNIKHFGGDPDKVTIFGESAGAASVSYQLQSECSKGLYRSAIMQSGNSLCLWSLTRNASYVAFETGRGLEINTSDSKTLVEELRKVPYKKLQQISVITGTATLVKNNPLAGLVFSPVIEPPHEGAFFSSYSHQLLSEGKFNRVPVIMGINSNEANVIDDIPLIIDIFLEAYDIDYSNLAPADLTNNSLDRDTAGFSIRFYYFSLLPIGVQEKNVIRFASDDQFNRPTREAVIQMSKYVPVYFYRFSYKGNLGAGANSSYTGVGHGEDLGYFFKSTNEGNSTHDDRLMRKRLVKLWTNFVIHGKPTPVKDPLLQNIQWKEVGKDPKQLTFLDINDTLKLSTNPFKDSMDFYDVIYNKYGSPPYDTY
ncbi:unnamed protein product [Phyllotreta striolata]|uniref:Carboxylic ester hydrolase n=1 Tax=Phyllotreta striolata TaxID=444603 RepID=A0A9N9XLV5_PHYSR|nr:unnamed protein product [Phyllotreta striolata]